MSGLMRTILAPVVPMILAKTAPAKRSKRFSFGVPRAPILMTIPPEMMKSEPRSMMNEMYSRMTWYRSSQS